MFSTSSSGLRRLASSDSTLLPPSYPTFFSNSTATLSATDGNNSINVFDRATQHQYPAYCLSILLSYRNQPAAKTALCRHKAYCNALLNNSRSLTPCARVYVEHARDQAQAEAFDRAVHHTNPAYYAELCSILAEGQTPAVRSAFKRHEAFCLGLMGEVRRMVACASQFIAINPLVAIQDATSFSLNHQNAFYCHILCDLLASRYRERVLPSSLQHPKIINRLKRHEAYCYALRNVQEGQLTSLNFFITHDRHTAYLDAMNADLQVKNPLYFTQLWSCLLNTFPDELSKDEKIQMIRSSVKEQAQQTFSFNPHIWTTRKDGRVAYQHNPYAKSVVQSEFSNGTHGTSGIMTHK